MPAREMVTEESRYVLPICIPLHQRGGKLRDDTELRFALRSLEKHLLDPFLIIIVGPRLPTWITGVEHLPAIGLKSALALAAKRFPAGFLWWYDDCCALRDTPAALLRVTPASRRWSQGRDTKWTRQLNEIKARLEEEGIPAWDYSRPHGPYWFNKSLVDEGFADWPGMKAKFPWETWILSKRNWPRRHGVVKQYYRQFRSPPGGGRWLLNYNDAGNTEELRRWLYARFPDKSSFEAGEWSPRWASPVVNSPPDLRYVYINLERDTERRESFLREFPGVDWWRFPGCEGGLMWGEIARGLGLLGDLREACGEILARPRWGTVGCSISHVLCLKLATVAGGIVLFPDDVENTRGLNIKKLVAQALEHRPPGAGWIKLKNGKPLYQESEDSAHTSGGWTFRRLAMVPRDVKGSRKTGATHNTGSAAVIILKEQARAILAALPKLTSNHFDFELRAIVDEVPGGCWEMLGTGIVHAGGPGGGKNSVRCKINRERKGESFRGSPG